MDRDLDEMVETVCGVVQCDRRLIRQDLRKTRNPEATISNFFEGRMLMVLEEEDDDEVVVGEGAALAGSAAKETRGTPQQSKYKQPSPSPSSDSDLPDINVRGYNPRYEDEDEGQAEVVMEEEEDYSMGDGVIDSMSSQTMLDSPVYNAGKGKRKAESPIMLDSQTYGDTEEEKEDEDDETIDLTSFKQQQQQQHHAKPAQSAGVERRPAPITRHISVERDEEEEGEEEDDEASGVGSLKQINTKQRLQHRPSLQSIPSVQSTQSLVVDSQEQEEDSQSSAPPQKRGRLSEEEKTRRKEEREAESQRKRAEKEAEAARRKFERETSKTKQPVEMAKDMIIFIDPVVASKVPGIASSHAEGQVEVRLERHPRVERLIRWQRKVPQLNAPPLYEDEKDVVVWMEAIDLLVLLKQNTLAPHMTDLKAHLAGKKITIIIEGLSAHFSKRDKASDREFQSRFRGEAPKRGGGGGGGGAASGIDVSGITRGIVEHALIWFQMDAEVFVRTTNDARETAELLFMFTKAVASAPVKQTLTMFNFCTTAKKSATRTEGKDGLFDLWVSQLMQVKGVSEPLARKIAARYPSPRALFKAFCEGGPSLLENIDEARRHAKVSQRLYTFYMSNDPNLIID